MKYTPAVAHVIHGYIAYSCNFKKPLCDCNRVEVPGHLDFCIELALVRVHSHYAVIFHRQPSIFSASQMALLLRGDILPPFSALMTVERLILAFFASSCCVSPKLKRFSLMR